jgi:hypothetical protein
MSTGEGIMRGRYADLIKSEIYHCLWAIKTGSSPNIDSLTTVDDILEAIASGFEDMSDSSVINFYENGLLAAKGHCKEQV